KEKLTAFPSPQLYTLAGITLGKMGLYNKAIESFEAALRIDPACTTALYNLYIAYKKIGLYDKAEAVRKKLKLCNLG
ncbi:MAG: tetratricopeptide repeat protein, partial [Candidatus Omnitrophica bacterium]|nr:tetratricopeptide repeat protein [Candidatus Omnitrophota bacterium]